MQWKKIAALERVNLKRWRNQVHFVDPVANINEAQLGEKVESMIDTMHHRGERIVWTLCEASLGGRIRHQDFRDAIIRVDPCDPAERQYRRSTRVRGSGTYAFVER
jgi:hypothetical protein